MLAPAFSPDRSHGRLHPVAMGAVAVATVLFALSTLFSDLAAALDLRMRDKL